MFKIDKPEPMVVELEGKQFKVRELTTERFQKIQESLAGVGNDPIKVVLLVLDAKESEIAKLDIRTIRAFIHKFPAWILEASNPPEADGN